MIIHFSLPQQACPVRGTISLMKVWQKINLNSQLIEQYLVREIVIDGIRAFFKKEGFHEVETPLLVARPGTEPYLDLFQTELVVQEESGELTKKPGYLLTSPEYAMKKLLAAGLGSIFQICKSFRNNEGRSPHHNHEFTILEWYRVNADYTHVMDDCENLLIHLMKVIKKNSTELLFQGKKYDLSTPWDRFTVAELFEKYVGVSKDELLDQKALYTVAKQRGYQVTEGTSWDDLFYQLFLNEIETELAKSNRPVFVYDYPAQQAALSKKKADDPRFAERFELYLAGFELGNAFTELTDAEEQRLRLLEEVELRKKMGKPMHEIDEDFINALRVGLPPTGGIAVGVDRLIMLLADVPTIQETLLFPVADVFDLE
jgi:elongation factor P--(R)-beta-lysine ligase